MRLTREQYDFCVHVARALDKIRGDFDGAVDYADRTYAQMVLLGQGGTGKTHVVNNIVRETVARCFPEFKEPTKAVAFSHAQAYGIKGQTIHSQAKMNTEIGWSYSELVPGETARNGLRDAWENVVCLVVEEISMIPAALLNALAIRAAFGREDKWQFEAIDHLDEANGFARIPLVIFLGDFLQLKPPGSIGLADDLDAIRATNRRIERREPGYEKKKKTKIATGAKNGVGRFLALNQVFELQGTRRFKDTRLRSLLNCMRAGTMPPPKLLAALDARVLSAEGRDARLDKTRFRKGNEMGMYWHTVARWMHERSMRDARELGETCYFSPAVDECLDGALTPERAKDLLNIPNMFYTGRLPAFCPLHVGQRVRLTVPLAPGGALVQEAQGTVLEIVVRPGGDAGDDEARDGVQFLGAVPEMVYVKFDNYDGTDFELGKGQERGDDGKIIRGADGQPALVDNGRGVVAVLPKRTCFTKKYPEGRGRPKKVHFARTQIPLVPANVRTAQSSQGMTFKDGVIIDSRKLKQMEHDTYWLNLYTMLSRCTRLRDILLTQEIPRSIFEDGPPASVSRAMRHLRERAVATARRTAEYERDLGWQPYETGPNEDDSDADHDADDSDASYEGDRD